MAQTSKEKIVGVPNVGVVAFPGDMEDEHVAAVIRAIRSQKAAEQAAQTHKLNRPMPLTTEESERRRQLKPAQPLSSAIPHLPAWLNTPSTELGRQAGNWLSGEIGKALGVKLPEIDLSYVPEQEAAEFRRAHPVAGGVAQGISDIANSLTTPASAALLLTAPESKLMSGLFAVQALHGSYKDAQTAREAYREGNNEEATRYATESILSGAMGLAAGAHAVRPELGPQGEVLPPEKRPAPEFPALAAPMLVTLEGKIGGFGLPEYTESPIANYQVIYKSPEPKPEELNGAINDLVHARQLPGWNDPNASEHEARIAQQNFRDAANRLNRLQQMAVGQVRQLPSGEKVVYLTRAGLQDLAAGLRGGAPDPNYSLNGVSIGPRYIPIITANLQHLQTPHAQELTKLLNLGTGPKGDVTVSAVPAKGETLSDALSRLREEINHGWQKTFTNAMGNHLPAPEYKDLNDAIPPAMSGYLYQNGYPDDTGNHEDNRMRVLEASSKMMSGAPVDFGLTPDDVANYLFQYFDAVTREHGPEALDKLLHTTTLARNIKKDYANARYPSRGSQGQGTLSGLPAGGQGSPQAGSGAAGRRTAPVTGPPAQAGAATPSLAALRDEAALRRPSPVPGQTANLSPELKSLLDKRKAALDDSLNASNAYGQSYRSIYGDEDWEEKTEAERAESIDQDYDEAEREQEEEQRRREADEAADRELDARVAYMDGKQTEVETLLKRAGIPYDTKGGSTYSRYLFIDLPNDESATIRVSDHEPPVGRGGMKEGGLDYHDEAEVSLHPGSDSLTKVEQFLREKGVKVDEPEMNQTRRTPDPYTPQWWEEEHRKSRVSGQNLSYRGNGVWQGSFQVADPQDPVGSQPFSTTFQKLDKQSLSEIPSGDPEKMFALALLKHTGRAPMEFSFVNIHTGYGEEQNKFGITGTGHAREVLRKVSESLAGGISRLHPGIVYFTAKEPSRAALYEKMLRHTAHGDYIPYKGQVPGFAGVYALVSQDAESAFIKAASEIGAKIERVRGSKGTDITMNQVRATKDTARPSVQALMAEALSRRPTQPTLSEVTKDIAARAPSVVP